MDTDTVPPAHVVLGVGTKKTTREQYNHRYPEEVKKGDKKKYVKEKPDWMPDDALTLQVRIMEIPQ